MCSGWTLAFRFKGLFVVGRFGVAHDGYARRFNRLFVGLEDLDGHVAQPEGRSRHRNVFQSFEDEPIECLRFSLNQP